MQQNAVIRIPVLQTGLDQGHPWISPLTHKMVVLVYNHPAPVQTVDQICTDITMQETMYIVHVRAEPPIERFHVTSPNFDFVAMAIKIILQVAKVL